MDQIDAQDEGAKTRSAGAHRTEIVVSGVTSCTVFVLLLEGSENPSFCFAGLDIT